MIADNLMLLVMILTGVWAVTVVGIILLLFRDTPP